MTLSEETIQSIHKVLDHFWVEELHDYYTSRMDGLVALDPGHVFTHMARVKAAISGDDPEENAETNLHAFTDDLRLPLPDDCETT